MTRDIRSEIYSDLPSEGLGRTQYTRQAYGMLPSLGQPRILDVGCGDGVPTLELARLSVGQVIGVDVDKYSLDALVSKVDEQGLSGRVQVVIGSLFALGFRHESFDLVWAEGSIFVIGFERGLRVWRRLIKPGGYLAVHESVWLRRHPPPDVYDEWTARFSDIKTIPENLARISACGYEVVGHFALPEDAWWYLYYGPVQRRIHALNIKYAQNPEVRAVLDREQQEINRFRKSQQWYGSAFFLMQKRSAVRWHDPTRK